MIECLPFTGMPGMSRLFQTYVDDYGRLGRYYAGDWRKPDSFADVARKQDARPLNRDVIVSILARQNAAWKNEGLEAGLRDPRALAVVTGQQLGLFGGPLFTLYKALTAVRLAESLAEVLDRPVIPVFWLEGNDHDLDEVRSVTLPAGTFAYDGHSLPERGNVGSVGGLAFRSDIDRVRTELADALPQTEWTRDMLDRFGSAYNAGVTFTDAFAHTLLELVGRRKLVLINPEDCAVKTLAARLIRTQVRDYHEPWSALHRVSVELDQTYHAQVNARPVNAFVLTEHGREAIIPDGNGFRLQVSGTYLTRNAIADLSPCDLSPNVAMRPLVQDSLLPTIAYVAGPGEIAYFAQFKGLYEWAEIPMPIIYPRASVTLIEPNIRRLMQKHGLTPQDFGTPVDTLLRRLVLEGGDLEHAFDRAAQTLESITQQLRPSVEASEPTLGRTVEATGAQWQKLLRKLRQRAERATRVRHDQTRSQLERCRVSIMPGGKPQERVLPALYFLARYGPAWLEQVHSGISLEAVGRHQILDIV